RTQTPNRIPGFLRIPDLHPERRFTSTVAFQTHRPGRDRDSLAFRTAAPPVALLTYRRLCSDPGSPCRSRPTPRCHHIPGWKLLDAVYPRNLESFARCSAAMAGWRATLRTTRGGQA